jgi:hypothetical protein
MKEYAEEQHNQSKGGDGSLTKDFPMPGMQFNED